MRHCVEPVGAFGEARFVPCGYVQAEGHTLTCKRRHGHPGPHRYHYVAEDYGAEAHTLDLVPDAHGWVVTCACTWRRFAFTKAVAESLGQTHVDVEREKAAKEGKG